jgi:N-acetylglucosamine kinase-like BadF-type ATPase
VLVAGIDGGQSSTVAVIADEHGRVLARGNAGPADEIGAGADSRRLRDALAAALAEAMRNAALPPDTRFEAIVAGISGYEGRVFGVPPELPTQRLTLVHDTRIAHAGALGGEPGVVVIAGTGSVAYALSNDGRSALAGGWGYLFGDEGSAFWIVRSAISLAAAHEQCAGTERLLSFFDVHSLRELVRGFYVGLVGRDELASFAPRCIEAAKADDACGCLSDPVRSAPEALANLAAAAAGALEESLPVAFTGGLLRDTWFRAHVYEALGEAASIREPRHEPVIGAVLLALREAGVERPSIA